MMYKSVCILINCVLVSGFTDFLTVYILSLLEPVNQQTIIIILTKPTFRPSLTMLV